MYASRFQKSTLIMLGFTSYHQPRLNKNLQARFVEGICTDSVILPSYCLLCTGRGEVPCLTARYRTHWDEKSSLVNPTMSMTHHSKKSTLHHASSNSSPSIKSSPHGNAQLHSMYSILHHFPLAWLHFAILSYICCLTEQIYT